MSNYSKIDLEQLFPYATMKEALQCLQKRHRHMINVEMGLIDLEPYKYRISHSRDFKRVSEEFDKLLK